VVRKGWLGKLPAMPLRWRVRSVMAVLFAVLAPRWWQTPQAGHRSRRLRW
jgi:hypothetical protein